MKRILDLPLMHDHHSHVSLYAAMTDVPDLRTLERDEIMHFLATRAIDALTLVAGWRSDRFELASEQLGSLPPLVLVNASLHGCLVSASALPYLKPLWPDFAAHCDDGLWLESRLPDLFIFYGKIAGFDEGKLRKFMNARAEEGIGSLEDMTVAGAEALSVIASSGFGSNIRTWASPACYRSLPDDMRVLCSGIKLFFDGSIGARSAALDAPFLSGESGTLLHEDSGLGELLEEIASWRQGLSIHAIGHRAIEQALRLIETVDGLRNDFKQIRLEHVQFISAEQAKRARSLGLVLSMQPNFNSDSVDYADRLTAHHRSQNNPFRMLIDEFGFKPGIDLVFGSDGMPHGTENAFQNGLFPPYISQSLKEEELLNGFGPSLNPDAIRAVGLAAPRIRLEIDDTRRLVRRLRSEY